MQEPRKSSYHVRSFEQSACEANIGGQSAMEIVSRITAQVAVKSVTMPSVDLWAFDGAGKQ